MCALTHQQGVLVHKGQRCWLFSSDWLAIYIYGSSVPKRTVVRQDLGHKIHSSVFQFRKKSKGKWSNIVVVFYRFFFTNHPELHTTPVGGGNAPIHRFVSCRPPIKHYQKKKKRRRKKKKSAAGCFTIKPLWPRSFECQALKFFTLRLDFILCLRGTRRVPTCLNGAVWP